MSAVQIYIYKHRGKQNQWIDFNQWWAKNKAFLYQYINIEQDEDKLLLLEMLLYCKRLLVQ